MTLFVGLCFAVVVCPIAADDAPTQDVPPDPFPIRAVKVRGDLADESVRAHIDFSLQIGFNALWIPSGSAGRWAKTDTGDRPELFAEFLALTDRCRRAGVRIYLALEPVVDAQGSIVLSDTATVKRLARFARLARKAGVHDFVISFHGAGLRLTELTDLLVYGRIAARAHVELTERLARKLGARDRVWFAPTIRSDEHLDDSRLQYSKELLGAITGLDSQVGIVWSGPKLLSPTITAEDLSAIRARFGGRSLILDDRYPANGSGERVPLALILGPLRERDPALAGEIEAYVSTPMGELGASRLALLTIAAFLADPDRYDADERWLEAMKRLAGDAPEALDALKTQALEWGGWIGTANYHTAFDENPQTAAQSLRDPAEAAFWVWPTRTYPDRMAELETLGDARFGEELLLTMARRLAVARAVPVVREILSVPDRPSDGLDTLVDTIQSQRRALARRPEVLLALDRFFYHAGIGPLLRGAEMPEEGSPEP